MSRSRNVKTLLLINLLLTVVGMGAVSAPVRQVTLPQLECGFYKASGKVLRNSAGQFLLTMNAGSDSPTEFLILGGDFDARFDRMGTRTEAELYVPQPIVNNEAPFVFLQKFGAIPDTRDDGVELVKKHRCGDKSKFVALH